MSLRNVIGMYVVLTLVLTLDPCTASTNIALNLSRTGFPHPLESDDGWGGGTDKWDIVDGAAIYASYANGLAFTGGSGPYGGEPAGPRQATINLGETCRFDKVILYHHGHADVPAVASVQYWDGSQWLDVENCTRTVSGDPLPVPSGWASSLPDTWTFDPVEGSKVRYSFDNSGLYYFEDKPMRHGWIYEFEVWSAPPSQNLPPVADAGPPMAIYSSEQVLAETIVAGTATDPDPDSLTYRWLEGGTILWDWVLVGPDDTANLSLASVPILPLGDHTLTLEVTDGQSTVSDTMTLTISNTPPDGQPVPIHQVVEINVDTILIAGEVADFDGDEVSYEWRKGVDVLGSGGAQPPAGGDAVAIAGLVVPAGDPAFGLGVHEVVLALHDGANPEESVIATVEVKDTTSPTLAPRPSVTMLWPPNHELRSVTVMANATDNGCGAITLAVDVTSNEPGDDDWYIDSVDNSTGVIELRLRAERTGTGDGRVYAITVTATDESLNETVALAEVRVPHDRRKEK